MEPWGEDRADWRIGQLACALESLWSSSPSWTPWQFMLPHARPVDADEDEEQSAEDQAEIWRLIAARYED